MDSVTNRRIKALRMSNELFVDLDATHCLHYTKNPLPADATCAGFAFDFLYNAWTIYIRSSEYEEVPEYSAPTYVESPWLAVSDGDKAIPFFESVCKLRDEATAALIDSALLQSVVVLPLIARLEVSE